MATAPTALANQPFTADAIAIMAHGKPQQAERIDVIVEGEPEVQERTRISFAGHTHLYDPSSKIKAKFRWAVLKSLKALKFSEYPLFPTPVELKLTVTFYVTNNLKDNDNLLKFLLDAIQTILYSNDRQVVKIDSEKICVKAGGYTVFVVEPWHLHPVHRIE